jgi:hypothetical protein
MRSCLLAVSILFTTSAAPAQVTIDPPIVDLGAIRAGKTAECVFRLHNRGPASAELLDLERSCGCVAPEWPTRVLKPGETTTVIVKLRTLGQAEGPRSWPLTLVTRAGSETTRHAIEIKACISREISLTPPQLGLFIERSLEQEITLTDPRPVPLTVRHWTSDVPGIRIEKLSSAGGITKLRLFASGDAVPAGRHDGVIRLETNDVFYDVLEIPLTLTKRAAPRVVWSPESPEVILAPGQKKASVLIRVRGLTSAIDSAAGSGVQCVWTADGDAVVLRATLDRSQIPAGAVQSAVHIQAGPDRIAIPLIVRAE